MDVIDLRPQNEIKQLNRLLDGIDKKRRSRQDRLLKILLGVLAAVTLTGLLATNYRIESALAADTKAAGRIYIYAQVQFDK